MTAAKTDSLKDLMAVVNSADIGLVIFDKNYHIRVWNLFMVNHSGFKAEALMGKILFDPFPDILKQWFVGKAQQCIAQKQKLLCTWKEQPYLFKFENSRSKAKSAAFMYQNITFIPLTSASGEVDNFAITINDVTDIAASTQQLDAVVSEYSPNRPKNNQNL
ncbi:hypothetical protein MNBD_GAMMA23-1333 [hydrothermal vent metagenome]|uniref:PAS domain-containing protein n=1 Tax=hydrothermal vent metagenome TaxID=652676 RepID=A0A3B1A5I7_9ZZZZ